MQMPQKIDFTNDIPPTNLLEIGNSESFEETEFYHFDESGDDSNEMSVVDLDDIKGYLANPTEKGIWKLKFEWLDFGGVSEEIFVELLSTLKGLNKNEISKLAGDVVKMSFIFSLFDYVSKPKKNETSETNLFQSNSSEYLRLFKKLDLKSFRTKYREVIDFFNEEIFFEQFKPIVVGEQFCKIKNGIYLLEKNLLGVKKYNENVMDAARRKKYKTKVSIVSLKPEPLEALLKFYDKVGKISGTTIQPVYSPEEEVFSPYFYILEEAYRHIFDSENVKSSIKKSVDEYKNDEYPYCINTIGVLSEDIVTQVYETFFRSPVPKQQTLGQLFDLISSEIKKSIGANVEEPLDPQKIYLKIKTLLKNDAKLITQKDILKVVRDMLNLFENGRKRMDTKISDFKKGKTEYSVFPISIRSNINEIIRNRNATSHKSRIPIGKYEALRSVYCCVTLINWWEDEKKIINWKQNPGEIIKDSVDRNSFI